jgi:hypothetical protein
MTGYPRPRRPSQVCSGTREASPGGADGLARRAGKKMEVTCTAAEPKRRWHGAQGGVVVVAAGGYLIISKMGEHLSMAMGGARKVHPGMKASAARGTLSTECG